MAYKNKAQLRQEIHEEVQRIGKRDNITPTPGRKNEMSGMAHGEEFVFLNSLIHTTEETGAWLELPDLQRDFLIEVLAKAKTM